MIEAGALQTRQRGTLHARGPGQKPTLFRFAAQRGDYPPPHSLWHKLRLQAAKSINTSPYPPTEVIQPPGSQPFGNLGAIEPSVGNVQAVRWALRVGQSATSARGKPRIFALVDGRIDRHAIQYKVQPQP
jgi:hypothetical protein